MALQYQGESYYPLRQGGRCPEPLSTYPITDTFRFPQTVADLDKALGLFIEEYPEWSFPEAINIERRWLSTDIYTAKSFWISCMPTYHHQKKPSFILSPVTVWVSKPDLAICVSLANYLGRGKSHHLRTLPWGSTVSSTPIQTTKPTSSPPYIPRSSNDDAPGHQRRASEEHSPGSSSSKIHQVQSRYCPSERYWLCFGRGRMRIQIQNKTAFLFRPSNVLQIHSKPCFGLQILCTIRLATSQLHSILLPWFASSHPTYWRHWSHLELLPHG